MESKVFLRRMSAFHSGTSYSRFYVTACERKAVWAGIFFVFCLRVDGSFSMLPKKCWLFTVYFVMPMEARIHAALKVPMGSPLRGGDVTVCVWHEQAELAHSFFFLCVCVYSVLVSISVFMAFSTVLHSINSPNDLRFLTLLFRSCLCLIGPFNYLFL